MKSPHNQFRPDTLIHCYQNTIDGFLLFYSISDYLVLFSRYCITAKKYNIVTHALCLMPDHLHAGVSARSRKDLSGFWCEFQTLSSKDNNSVCSRKGHLFNPGFGFAPKEGGKRERTNLIYIGNNPVERHLVRFPEDYRWNFLAYADSNHPFSKRLVIRRASASLKRAIRIVKDLCRRGHPLSYILLQKLFAPLTKDERLQLVDYIVVTYSVIDYSLTRKLFGSMSNAINAMHTNTGSEYDIKEPKTGKSDEHYAQITAYLLIRLSIKDIHEVFSLTESQRVSLFKELQDRFYTVPPGQIAKYLRIPFSLRL